MLALRTPTGASMHCSVLRAVPAGRLWTSYHISQLPPLRVRHSTRPRGHRSCLLGCTNSAPHTNGGASSVFRRNHDKLFGRLFRSEIGDELMQKMVSLPRTTDYVSLLTRMESLLEWKIALRKGILPHGDKVIWPEEPFRSKFGKVLEKLEIPNLTRRYPKLLPSLLHHMMELVQVFEDKLAELETTSQAKSKPKRPPKPSQESLEQASESSEDADPSNGDTGPSNGDMEPPDGDMEPSDADSLNGQQTDSKGSEKELEVEVESTLMDQDEDASSSNGDEDEFASELEKMAEGIVHDFEEDMKPVVESLNKASLAFDDLDELVDETKGFGLERSLWKRTGWREIDKLRKKLEDLTELRELVRSLGRAGGRGPKRKAPAEISKSKYPPGVVRSPLQPEETTGLSRSGDLSRMLPSEAALMAIGYPRDGKSKHEKVSRAAKLLHLVRRAERNLMSYERAGWLEDEPSKILHYEEYRPAAEQGPIIVCLDTSGSMQGPRETVAKALVLECLRGAHRQERNCYLYAFSSYHDIREMELSIDARSISRLLDFLEHSFGGGTDVNGALDLSIRRLADKEWSNADILIVTDGEMRAPRESVLQALSQAQEYLGLEVHGLLVGKSTSDPMERICSHLHVFKSWDTAKRVR